MRRIHLLLLSLIMAILLGLGVIPASAHAVLMDSAPAENASLPQSPATVELTFSEALDPNFSHLDVMDTSNKQVDAGDAHLDPSDPTRMVVSLSHLGDGVYTVMWTAVSAVDSHQTTGSYPFSVGAAMAGTMGSTTMAPTNSPFDVSLILAKLLLYLPTTAIIGALMFTLLVWNPSLMLLNIKSDTLPAYPFFSRKLLVGALALLASADVVSIFTQAGQVGGHLIGWPWQTEFWTVLLATRFGALVVARLAIVFILAGLLLTRPNRWNRYLALAISLLLLLTFSLGSHAASEPHPTLPILADWVHYAAISVWVGGLISFLIATWSIYRIAPSFVTKFTSILIPHFTMLAMSSVAFLVLTGVYSAFLRVGTLAFTIDTVYGRVLLLKLFVIAPMLALGGFHFLVTSRLMKRAAGKANGSYKLFKLFRRLLTFETFLGLTVLLIVGILTTLPPARAMGTFAGVSLTTTADDLKVRLQVDPGHPGMNTFTATITSGGKPVTNASDVSLEFNSQSGMMGASKAAMTRVRDGVYTLRGGYLSMVDQWSVNVVVLRAGKYDAYARYTVPIIQPASRVVPWEPITIALLLASAVCAGFFILMVTKYRPRTWSWVEG